MYSSSDCAASFMSSTSLVDYTVELKLEVVCVQTSRFGRNVWVVGAGIEWCATQAWHGERWQRQVGVKVMGVLCISDLKSLGARTTSLDYTSCSQSASVYSELRIHSDTMSISGGCDSLPSRVQRYSIIQLSVQISQWHIMFVVTYLGAAILLDADGVIVLVIWVESSNLTPDRNLDSGLMRIRCLWCFSLLVSPCAEAIFERLKLGALQWIIQSVEVLETFISSKFSGLISNTFTVWWAIGLPRNLLSKYWSSFELFTLTALLVFLSKVNCKRIILTRELILILKILSLQV